MTELNKIVVTWFTKVEIYYIVKKRVAKFFSFTMEITMRIHEEHNIIL